MNRIDIYSFLHIQLKKRKDVAGNETKCLLDVWNGYIYE